MKKFYRDLLHKIAEILEVVVATIIVVVIFLCICLMILHILQNPLEIDDSERFSEFLSDALSLIVGIEFLKMIIIPTADNVIDTLMFAVARQIILDHDMTVTTIGVLCVAILFAIRKFLFSKHFEEVDASTYRGSTPIKVINRLEHIKIPSDEKVKNLQDYTLKEFSKTGRVPSEGSVVETEKGIALRVDKIVDGKLIKIEVIKDLDEDINN